MEFIGKVLQIYTERWPWFLELLGEQLRISMISVLLAGTIGLFLGILISEHRRFAEPVMAFCNLFYTIPAIALIGLLIPLIGIGRKNAIAAIVLYGLMPMVRNTYTGLTGVDGYTTDAQLGVQDVVALEDDKHLQVNYFCSTVVREDTLESHPGLEDALMLMDGILSDSEMASLNAKVEVDGRDEAAVAKEYLEEKGILEG